VQDPASFICTLETGCMMSVAWVSYHICTRRHNPEGHDLHPPIQCHILHFLTTVQPVNKLAAFIDDLYLKHWKSACC